MPYAIKENGQFRAVAGDMELTEDETLYEQVPQWLIDFLEQQQINLQNVTVEAEWRGSELMVISRQLEAIEEYEAGEAPPDLIPGTRKQWLKYRGQVSNWKEGAESFPDIAHRPVRPS
ncbi:hypothetical protein [Pseudomonas sp. RA_15y_Pfl2_54]|uniref:hypothetical protein n=1 Tax=Pseudomonas sp. RA_15y_Pfl2_54 TaxID=3088704 RepID=UPI0030DAFE2D